VLLSGRVLLVVTTALAPALWGSTYIVFTQLLPTDYPLLVSAIRALPAGLILMLLGAGLPPRSAVLPLAAVGLANIGLFFGFLFVGAARLPAGLAATLGATQPLIVAFLAWFLLKRPPTPLQVAAAAIGVGGVALLVMMPTGSLDLVGIGAALCAALSMALGTVLIAKWGRLGTPLQLAAWQLALGGLLLAPVAVIIEGAPPVPTPENLAGMAYLILVGTALAYWVWVRGITRLGAVVAFLGLLTPVVATILGALVAGDRFSPWEFAGMGIVLGATVAGIAASRPGTRAPASAGVGERSGEAPLRTPTR
jgi:probable blue pigment (indigoidine) exporter